MGTGMGTGEEREDREHEDAYATLGGWAQGMVTRMDTVTRTAMHTAMVMHRATDMDMDTPMRASRRSCACAGR